MKKKNYFGLLLVAIFMFCATVVYAADALTEEKFEEKMKELDYECYYGYCSNDDSVMFTFEEADTKEEADEGIDKAKKEYEEYKKLKISDVKSGNKRCLSAEGTVDEEYGYVLICRNDKNIIMAQTDEKGSVSEVKNTMKELGYYTGSSVVVWIIVGVVVVAVVGVVVYFVLNKKKNNGMPMNNGFNQPMNNGMPMNNNLNNQPMTNPMNNGFNQPVNNGMPMNNNLNNQPMANPMNNGMDFSQPTQNNNNNNFPNMN